LSERLGFPWSQIREVRLIVGVDARHQLDIRPVVVSQISIPRVAELMIAPRPLLLPWRDVMIGHVNHAGAGFVIVTSEEILFSACDHVTGWNRNIGIPTEVVRRIAAVGHKLAWRILRGHAAERALAIIHSV